MMMIVFLYKWKLWPGKEAQFKKHWSYITEQLREKCGSLGSRLQRGDDGLYYGYAQWPDRDTREKASLTHPEIVTAREMMNDAIQQRFPETALEVLADYLTSQRSK